MKSATSRVRTHRSPAAYRLGRGFRAPGLAVAAIGAALLVLGAGAAGAATPDPGQTFPTSVTGSANTTSDSPLTMTWASGVTASIAVTGRTGSGTGLQGSTWSTEPQQASYFSPAPTAGSTPAVFEQLGDQNTASSTIDTTVTFSTPVLRPILHIMNLDASTMTLGGSGLTAAMLANNTTMTVNGLVVHPTATVPTQGGCQLDDGSNTTGACGSFLLDTGGPISSFTMSSSAADGDGFYWTISYSPQAIPAITQTVTSTVTSTATSTVTETPTSTPTVTTTETVTSTSTATQTATETTTATATATATETAPGSTSTTTETAPGSTSTVTVTAPGSTSTVTQALPASTVTVTGPGATKTLPRATVTVTADSSGSLPFTGSDNVPLALLGGLLVSAGLALFAFTRPKGRHS